MITSLIIYRLSATLRETGFNDTKVETSQFPTMKEIDGSDGLTVTATKLVYMKNCTHYIIYLKFYIYYIVHTDLWLCWI